MSSRTFAEWLDMPQHTAVRAKARIHDCPSSRDDDGVPRGTLGSIEDYDTSAEMLVVSFEGDRCLLVDPSEIDPMPSSFLFKR